MIGMIVDHDVPGLEASFLIELTRASSTSLPAFAPGRAAPLRRSTK